MTSEKSFIAIELKAKGHQSHGMASVCHTEPRRGPGLWVPPPGPSAPDQQLNKRRDGAAQGAKEPRVSEPFPRISKDPLGTHTPGGSGLASGRGRGKGSRGWGPWDGAPLHSHRPPARPPHHHGWTRARAIVSLAAQSCVLFRHYFWRPEEEEKKAKKGVAVLGGTFARKGFQGLLGQRRQSLWIKRS